MGGSGSVTSVLRPATAGSSSTTRQWRHAHQAAAMSGSRGGVRVNKPPPSPLLYGSHTVGHHGPLKGLRHEHLQTATMRAAPGCTEVLYTPSNL
jgi:hypothetical protein